MLTGEGHGEVLAELRDFSFSSGSSTEFMRIFRAVRRRRLWTGLEGAVGGAYTHALVRLLGMASEGRKEAEEAILTLP